VRRRNTISRANENGSPVDPRYERLELRARKRLAIEPDVNCGPPAGFVLHEWYLRRGLINLPNGRNPEAGAQRARHSVTTTCRSSGSTRRSTDLRCCASPTCTRHQRDIRAGVDQRLAGVEYDVCVMTGDYRSKTYGPIDATLDAMRRIRAVLRDPIYGVLGNHDSLAFVAEFERMGIRMLVNEAVTLQRGDARIALVGIDDHHFYRLGSIPKAIVNVPDELPLILLSHAPEVYRQAALAGFDVMLCGHTHGGQICLPGGYPVTVDGDVPRRMGRGPWRRRGMVGYTSAGAGTSIVDVRINCPPEITLHRLRRAP
jgi:predicted MPP superfamily phosphohydrolase